MLAIFNDSFCSFFKTVEPPLANTFVKQKLFNNRQIVLSQMVKNILKEPLYYIYLFTTANYTGQNSLLSGGFAVICNFQLANENL